MTTPGLTPAQEELLEQKFKHLMMLLNVSSLPKDVKDAWVNLLPEMTLEQMNRLIHMLEQEVHEALEYAQDHPEDQRLLDKLNEATQFHEEEKQNIEARTMAALQAIEDELPSSPSAPPTNTP